MSPEDLMDQNPFEVPNDMNEFGEPIEPETQPEPTTEPTPETQEPETGPEPKEPETKEPEEVQEPEPEKKVQTPEENAKFAEQRRQQQIEQRVQAELERIKKESPEFQMAQTLSQMYGQPVDQLYKQIQDSALQRQSQQTGVPVEALRQIQESSTRTSQLEAQLQRMQFETWVTRVDGEAATLQKDLPMLNQADMDSAKEYLLDTLKDPNLPLERAVYALHGSKITAGLREAAKQEALAELGGRNKSPLPAKGGKSSPTNSLTDEERYFAREVFGISEEEYMKNK